MTKINSTSPIPGEEKIKSYSLYPSKYGVTKQLLEKYKPKHLYKTNYICEQKSHKGLD
tara:strand:+ start:336 stop:509 length:174 start_codon:yes stop_codon:yes gene_type:complete